MSELPRPAPDRPLAAQWRDLANGIERPGGVALEPVEIEAHGPERNERWQDRGVRAVQPALRLGEFVTRETAQFSAGPLGASLAHRLRIGGKTRATEGPDWGGKSSFDDQSANGRNPPKCDLHGRGRRCPLYPAGRNAANPDSEAEMALIAEMCYH